MEIQRSGNVEYKVFKEDDLKRLADYFVDIKEELNNENTTLSLKIEFEDGSSIKGPDASILDDTKSKLVKLITFHLYNYYLNKRIYIHIFNRQGSYKVGSKDRDWVDAKFSQLDKILKETPDQNYWLSNFYSQTIISNLLGIIAGFSFYYLFLRNIMNEAISEDPLSHFVTLFFTLMIGQILTVFILKKVLFNLYPEIEFDTTLAHLNKSKVKKNILVYLFSKILLPLGISIIASLLFWLFLKN